MNYRCFSAKSHTDKFLMTTNWPNCHIDPVKAAELFVVYRTDWEMKHLIRFHFGNFELGINQTNRVFVLFAKFNRREMEFPLLGSVWQNCERNSFYWECNISIWYNQKTVPFHFDRYYVIWFRFKLTWISNIHLILFFYF